MFSKYEWSHDLFKKYETHELRRKLVLSCVSGRCKLFVGSDIRDVTGPFLYRKKWDRGEILRSYFNIKGKWFLYSKRL